VDVSGDVETAATVHLGHTRLLVTEDENQTASRAPNSLARKLMTEGPNASIEDLIKDAIIVPETKPLDDPLADLQRHRSSMAAVIDEYGRVAGIVSGHHRGGRRRSTTDRPTAAGCRPANGDWFVRGHAPPTCTTTASPCRSTPTPTTRSGGFVFAELGRCQARRHGQQTATRSAWNRCARTASKRSGSATAGDRGDRRGVLATTARLTAQVLRHACVEST
jgi:hypothetical protein